MVNGLPYQAMAVAARDTFPTLPSDALFAIASRQQLKTIHPEAQLIATTMFLDAPESAGAAIRDAVAAVAPGATVEGRAGDLFVGGTLEGSGTGKVLLVDREEAVQAADRAGIAARTGGRPG